MDQLRERQVALDKMNIPDGPREKVAELEKEVRSQAEKPVEIDSLSRSDREYELETWLDEKEIENAWELAPVLVNLNYDLEKLENLSGEFSPEQLSVVIPWLGTSYTVYSLLAEINQGAERISEIVKSLKSYVYLDQAPIQSIDIHEGLDNTLVMLRHKLKAGVTVRREYSPDLPRIQAYGSELNQVWTNIIDNAIDAMNGKGEITLRTRQEEWFLSDRG
jgi:signal transduction histidine kinase